MDCILYDQVRAYQAGNNEIALELLETFAPLLKKYARLLHTEDALEELQYHLLDALKTMNLSQLSAHSDGVMVSYVRNIVHNRYIFLSKSYRKINGTVSLEDLNPYDAFQYMMHSSSTNDYSLLFFSDVREILSDREYQVILLLFQYGYTVAEAAKLMGKSRQAVNQIKNRALKKLKQKFVDNSQK